ncbi:hypothetical protein D9M68_784920 [compost metagenome]
MTAVDADLIWAKEMSRSAKCTNAVIFVVTTITAGACSFNCEVFPVLERWVIVANCCRAQPKACAVLGFVVEVSGMKKGLCRYVTPVWRFTTKSIFLDDGNALASSGGDCCGCASAGAASDDNEIVIKCWFFCHYSFSLYDQAMMFV